MPKILAIFAALVLGWDSLAATQESPLKPEAPASVNLLPNPGFEMASKRSGLPEGGWWVYQNMGTPEVALDRQILRSGNASLRLHAPDEAKFTLVSPPFPVAPGDDVHFEVWIRADSPQDSQNVAHAGLAFRRSDGRVFERAYVVPKLKNNEWLLLSTNAAAPADAVSAEVHLAYNNASGPIWFDDAKALIASPLSLSMVQAARPWVGRQEIAVLVKSRLPARFQGMVRTHIHHGDIDVPISLEANASQQVKIPIALENVGVHSYTISLLDKTGVAQRSLAGKFHTAAPLGLHPACPCYHVVGEGNGKTCLAASILVEPSRRAGLRFVASLTDTAGKEVNTATVNVENRDVAEAVLKTPIDKAGDYLITARLLDRQDHEIDRATTDVHVGGPGPSRVLTGPDGFLRIEGKPLFPIGMYSCGHFEEMGASGFNATHSYQITTGNAGDPINDTDRAVKKLLDNSWKNGMRMMVELPRKAIEQAQWQQVRRRIETFRNHPGLLCWGSEERVARGEAPLKNIQALYKLVHDLDPNHPLVLGDTCDVIGHLKTDRRNFFPDPCMDAGVWWWYPIPLRGSTTDGDALEGREKGGKLLEPPSWLTTTLSKKPLWIAIQSYQQPWLDARFPTPQEYRAMAYLSIINGVKGLWFYTGYGQKDYYGKPSGLLNKTAEGHWDYVRKLAGELREFSPVIMAAAPKEKVSISPANAPVEFALRELDGKTYLIAANKSETSQSVSFAGSPLSGKQAQVLYEEHRAALDAETLKDTFDPFGVHVYRLE